jgi:LAO/AO transport system kinase
VLVTTAVSGEGVPELLAALDRHRAGVRDGETPAARLFRAEAQVGAILAQRIHERLSHASRSGATRDVYDAVARHELDPYTASDRLLALLDEGPPAEG